MTAPPSRSAVSGSPSRAAANAGFGALYDYLVGLLGTTGNAPDARKALGVPNTGPLSGMRNLVINGRGAINQRGYVSGAATSGANQYTLDRWRVVVSGQSLSWTASGNGKLMTAPAGGVEQVIEGASIAGGTYTINWIGTATCTVNSTTYAKGATVTLAANTNATVRLSAGTFDEVQLEPGEVATGFEARPIGMELLLCQRYYWRGLPLGGFNWSAYVASAICCYSVKFPVTMRAVPTLARSTAGATLAGLSGESFDSATVNGARMLFTSTTVTNNAYVLYGGADYLEASAEL
jgi:hypothetical protein